MVPKVGNYYHFWDDGKTGPSRHYICKCEKIIRIKEAKSIMIHTSDNISLYDIWKEQVEKYNWIYAKETDYFIEISCPTYDDNHLYAVRTKDGGWFTLNIQSWWQDGTLDVTGEIYENVLNDWEEYQGYRPYDSYPEANEDNYKKRDN